jgi:hypothetical protein
MLVSIFGQYSIAMVFGGHERMGLAGLVDSGEFSSVSVSARTHGKE